ncbi:hypothetical protein BH23ACT6_BH23ACT6_28230 [soil metagenome]
MSRLRTAAEDYLAMRRTLGFKLVSQGRLLMEFIDYCDQHQLAHVRTDAAIDWATNPRKGGHDGVYHARRLMVVRIFARHLAAIDPATEIPPPDVLAYHYRRATPHVFTTDEIHALIIAAHGLQPAMRAATWRTLLGLLAVTGMRISEACNLNVDDIDENSGVVRIINSSSCSSPSSPAGCCAAASSPPARTSSPRSCASSPTTTPPHRSNGPTTAGPGRPPDTCTELRSGSTSLSPNTPYGSQEAITWGSSTGRLWAGVGGLGGCPWVRRGRCRWEGVRGHVG